MIRKVKAGLILHFTLLTFIFCFTFLAPVLADISGIEYSSYVQNNGWQNYVKDGTTSGTEGQSLRLEGIKIKTVDAHDVGVEYRAHVENIGWQDWVGEDQLSGTEGQDLRLEAISIRLIGSDSPNYSIYYRVHTQDYGWLGWAKNGEDAGSEGLAKRVEAIQIMVQPVNNPAPDSDQPAFVTKPVNENDNSSPIHYRVYIAGQGWPDWAHNGEEHGSGDIRGIEAIAIGLSDEMRALGGIQYKKLGNAGWTPWLNEEDVAGAPGDPIQGLRIRLTGKLAYLKDVYYRLHSTGIGWTNLARNGEACGSEGLGRPCTLVQIWITNKAETPNAPYGGAFTQGTWYWPLDGIHGLSTLFGQNGSSHHDGIDIPAGSGTPIKSAKTGTVIYVGYADGLNHSVLYGAFGNCVAVEHDSGEICYYAHMSRIGTSLGQRVGRGQVIGYVGTTGNSLGNHLHFEVYDSGQNLVDPLNFY